MLRPLSRGRFALLALIAALAAAALPAAAGAAVTTTLTGTTVTVSGDGADDTITLAVNGGGNLTVNGNEDLDPAGGNQTLTANDTADIIVNAGGGNDTVDATALAANQYKSLTVDGEAGDDLITGGFDADNLQGGDNNDRVVGHRGGDTMAGGNGNDVLVWNNGDGSDVIDGDAGNDETEVNGRSSTVPDVFTIAASATPGRVQFDRAAPGPFTLDVNTERMTVNGLAGDDTMTGGAGLAPLIGLTLNGGSGADTLTGGDGADLINGGEGDDTLNGGDGGDRLSGDRGNDDMNGGDGDDALVWNNGDNNDTMDGDAGQDRVEVNGAGAGDTFTLTANAPRATFDRTNLVPFTLDILAETLAVNGLAGDDTFTAGAGTGPLIALNINGGAGNDTITGAEGHDTLAGGSGNDTITGGAGTDVIDGNAGDDNLQSRDGEADLVRGGADTDSATTDALNVDTVIDVENVDPAPAGGPALTAGVALAGTTLTITGDGSDDTIVLAAIGGKLTVNGNADLDPAAGAQTLAADDNADIVVNVDGGNDSVDATALAANQYKSLTVDGGPGDDLIVGGFDADALRGGDGTDRVVGHRGNDDMEGGNGNDVLVWNNGDGSDTIDGDAGNDETEVNGRSSVVADVFTIAANGARVKFDRAAPGPFSLDVSTERMTVNGLAGDDSMTAGTGLGALIALTLNGGSGTDTLSGGDGADVINGGEDADVLAGGGGSDRLVGDRGNDQMAGGDGDDALVWNNGDNNDKMDGDDGVDHVEVNGAGAGDTFTLAVNGARTKFDRTNLVPFTLDILAEALVVNGLGGDDTFTAADGTGALIALFVDGGPGNDTITGADGQDTLLGGSGNDALTGGGNWDLIDGQAGDDTLQARDGGRDLVRCDGGSDSAVTDALSVDAVDGCEAVDATPEVVVPPGDTKGLAATIGTSRAAVSRTNRVKIAVSCPAAETGGCAGTLALTTRATVRIGRYRLILLLGSAKFSLKAGERKTLTVKVPAGLRALVRKSTLGARAETTSKDAAGNLATSARNITLTLPRR